MNYKGYKISINGVFKVKNNQKFYALEICKGTEKVFKSDWIYNDQKKAFKDAKEMIKKNNFSTEIIRKNMNKEALKKDEIYKSQKRKEFSNKVIIISIILMLISYILMLMGIKNISKDYLLFVFLYVIFGFLFSLVMLFWGIFIKGRIELNNKQQLIYKLLWWLHLLFNHGPILLYLYKNQPFKDKEKGWYSSNVFIALLFETLFGIFIILECIISKKYLLLFWGLVMSYLLLIINYIFSIVWEVNNAKSNGDSFPFKRIISPILVLLVIILFIILYSKIF